jgi:hypothetical protein
MYPVPEIHHQVGRLKDNIVITARFVQLHPVGRIFHRESIFLAGKHAKVLLGLNRAPPPNDGDYYRQKK